MPLAQCEPYKGQQSNPLGDTFIDFRGNIQTRNIQSKDISTNWCIKKDKL